MKCLHIIVNPLNKQGLYVAQVCVLRCCKAGEQSWAHSVFFNFFNNKKLFFCIFDKVSAPVLFKKPTPSQISLIKKCKKSFFFSEKIYKFRKCPALLASILYRGRVDSTMPQKKLYRLKNCHYTASIIPPSSRKPPFLSRQGKFPASSIPATPTPTSMPTPTPTAAATPIDNDGVRFWSLYFLDVCITWS